MQRSTEELPVAPPPGTPRPLTFRAAEPADLAAVVLLLADDPLGATREQAGAGLDPAYPKAFAAIQADPNNRIIVAVQGTRVVGCLQLTLIPHLTHTGGWRGQIEGVRVAVDCRGQGIGQQLLRHAIAQAAAAGCRLVQLTSDRSRVAAGRFYERLGFVPSHVGYKLALP